MCAERERVCRGEQNGEPRQMDGVDLLLVEIPSRGVPPAALNAKKTRVSLDALIIQIQIAIGDKAVRDEKVGWLVARESARLARTLGAQTHELHAGQRKYGERNHEDAERN